MEQEVKKDILDVLRKTLSALEKPEPDTSLIREISNHTVHNASIYQDEHSISIAILVYSLSKIIERVNNHMDYSKIKNLISISIEYLEDDNVESYHKFINQIFSIVSKTDAGFKMYIQEVIRQARIKKSSKIYDHGVSASKTAEILGVSLWDFYEYLGATSVSDTDTDIVSVRQKLEFTRRLFS
jgi:hypothetical protein